MESFYEHIAILFTDNNPHTRRIAEFSYTTESKTIEFMEWPADTSDLNLQSKRIMLLADMFLIEIVFRNSSKN